MNQEELNAIWTFTSRELTEQVNEIPNQFGLIGDLGWAPADPVSTTVVEIARKGYEIVVLPAVPRGGEASTLDMPKEGSVFIEIPSYPVINTITPKDLQDWVDKSNRTYSPKTLASSVFDKLRIHKESHDLLVEYQRVSALKGQIRDGNGTLLIDLFRAFDKNQKTVNFELDNPDTDVLAKCEEIETFIRLNLLGETMTGVEVLVDAKFLNKLVSHPQVQKFYLGHAHAQIIRDPKFGKYGRMFEFGGIMFREYTGFATLYDKSTVPMINEGEGHALPVGTRATFSTFFAPAHDIRAVNSPGLEIYMSEKILDHGAGVETKSESCPLPVWNRPELLVKVLQQ